VKKIAILFLGRRGAGPVYTYEISCALSRYAKLLVFLSSFIDNKEIWDREAKNNKNIKIMYIKTYNSGCGFLLSFMNIFRFIKIIRSMNTYNPDMIYSTWVHYWDPFIYPFLQCKLKVKTIHDVETKKGEEGIRWQWLRWFSFRHADKYIILSGRYRENLIAKGIDEHNIVLMPLAGFSYYNDGTQESGFIFHNKILFFGRIVEYKGLKVLLEAMKLVVKNNPGMKLVIAGDGDMSSYKNDVELLKENLEIHNNWIPNDSVKYYFKDTDLTIVPYIEATQSGIIPLSYVFSKPVIASKAGALPEQVKDGETGLLTDPDNPSALANAIQRLMSSPELLSKMGKKCNEYYTTELAWDSSAKKIISLFVAKGLIPKSPLTSSRGSFRAFLRY
jgi:glycosyltransferase involved in cell wall biosynthesis